MTIVATKRGPGRPRKSESTVAVVAANLPTQVTQSEPVTAVTPTQQPAVQAPRRRGRPPKNPVPAHVNGTSSVTNGVHAPKSSDAATSQVTAQPPKRRGRPPKNKEATTAAPVAQPTKPTAITSNVATVVKRRGRPPKNKTEATTATTAVTHAESGSMSREAVDRVRTSIEKMLSKIDTELSKLAGKPTKSVYRVLDEIVACTKDVEAKINDVWLAPGGLVELYTAESKNWPAKRPPQEAVEAFDLADAQVNNLALKIRVLQNEVQMLAQQTTAARIARASVIT